MFTVHTSTTVTQKIQRSEFITSLYPLDSVTEVKALLKAHSSTYPDATHHCYAYILGDKGEHQYFSDAGEPSGTAGKPILNALLSHNMTHVLAVVTRYFGGVKLGVRGLIEAYNKCTKDAIAKSDLKQFEKWISATLFCEYSQYESLYQALTRRDVRIETVEYVPKPVLQVSIPQSRYDEVCSILASMRVVNNI